MLQNVCVSSHRDREGSSEPTVGSRLSCDGHIGTLLYIGKLLPTKDTWFGVDWDDQSRGKHDGTQFHQLTVVCVRDHLVNGPGPAGALQSLCPDVTELDISRNLLNSWHTVAQIAAQLKKLQHLNVSENRLQLVDDPSEHQGSFQSLKQLVAWDMKYDWSQFLACARMWPDIEELKVANNNITTLESPSCGVLSRLKHLDLHGNNIQDWEEINKLGSLNMLEYLNASSIGVSRIHFPAASSSAKTHLFPALKHLNIDNNNIQEWVSVSELNKLASLEDLKLRDNPVTNLMKMESTVQIIIARIANLKLGRVMVTSLLLKQAQYADEPRDFGQSLAASRKSTMVLACYTYRCSERYVKNGPVSFHRQLHQVKREYSSVTKMLNAEAVSVDRKGANAAFISNDRKGAEYDYVKKHGQEWLSVINSEADKERFLTQHPRFPELIRKYGTPEEGEMTTMQSAIKFNIIFVDSISCPNEPEKKIIQKLPRSIQVNKVVAFAKQLFDTGGETPTLSYVDNKLPDTEVPIDNIMRDLKFYSVEDGGQIVVRW
uniref:Tubulin-specific chaperone E n=1 Tax=Timema tahoe TaxID=61484 RepID=A0A7R9IIL6_9NEOP|nr:unnamed protein product [Timema tahoe]